MVCVVCLRSQSLSSLEGDDDDEESDDADQEDGHHSDQPVSNHSRGGTHTQGCPVSQACMTGAVAGQQRSGVGLADNSKRPGDGRGRRVKEGGGFLLSFHLGCRLMLLYCICTDCTFI